MNNQQQTQKDISATMARGQALLDDGMFNEAMAYFWYAGERYAKIKDWEKVGNCLSKAAYCYELDGRYEMAAQEYERATEFYLKGHLSDKALKSRQAASAMKKYPRFPGQIEAVQTIVVGAVGLNASGKDIIIERLNNKFGVPTVSTGDITREVAQEEGIEPTRDNLHAISQRCWAQYGPAYYPLRVIKKIEEQEWPVAGVTGIRTPIDVRIFQDYYGENFILVYVEVTDPRIRFERMLMRAETRDPKTYEEFLQQDEDEEAIFRLQKAISMAAVKINNDGTLDEFYAAIDRLASRIGLSTL